MNEKGKDLAELKRVGLIQQKQKELFAMRLHAVGGDLPSEQLSKVAEVARRYGRGMVHLSTRQGIEIHNVPFKKLEAARKELASVGVKSGACGPRIRVIVACPGSATCRWGIIDTKPLARELDRKYFRKDTPHKFKMAVTGCPNNCAKATENDVGIMGGVLPRWVQESCIHCGLCVPACPTDAIVKKDETLELIREKCILCGICIAVCPSSSWKPERQGYTLFIGGTMGKRPRLGTRLKELIGEEDELLELIERAVGFYREHGKTKERFGHLMDRIGPERVREEILR